MFEVAFDLYRCFDTEGMRCVKNVAFSSVGDGQLQGSWSDTFSKVFGFGSVLVRYAMQVSLVRKQVPQVQTTGPKETLTPGVTGACCDMLWVTGALPQCVVCDMADPQDLLGRSRLYGMRWVCMTWG